MFKIEEIKKEKKRYTGGNSHEKIQNCVYEGRNEQGMHVSP